ncbi:MAG: c-type cytochrome [Aurantimonas coralicida]
MRKRIDFILTWKRIGAAAAAGVVAAFALGWSGMVPISASSGHFPPFGWFLHWVMGNAAEKQSLAVSIPDDLDLSDPALVKRGAGHFATGCAVCHGSPTEAQSPVVLSMTPHPPRLEERVPEWSDRELFWIVQHGIKYTGMPAWPTQARADEVWAQVAFLRALPGMSPAAYDDLALASGADGGLDGGNGAQNAVLSNGAELAFEDALADCARCHGRDGYGRGPAGAFPVLAGQPADYLLASLQAYSNGERASGFMQPPARRYDAEMLTRLAEHFAGVEGPEGPAATGRDGTDAAAMAPPAGTPKAGAERAGPNQFSGLMRLSRTVPQADTKRVEAKRARSVLRMGSAVKLTCLVLPHHASHGKGVDLCASASYLSGNGIHPKRVHRWPRLLLKNWSRISSFWTIGKTATAM